MIWLNPVTENDNSVKRGLYTDDTDVPSNLKCETFKEILTTDATMEDRGRQSCKIFWGSKTMEQIKWRVEWKTRRNQRLQAVLGTFISRQIRKYKRPCMV